MAGKSRIMLFYLLTGLPGRVVKVLTFIYLCNIVLIQLLLLLNRSDLVNTFLAANNGFGIELVSSRADIILSAGLIGLIAYIN